MKIVKYLTMMSLVFALTACGGEEKAPTTEGSAATETPAETAETPAETAPAASADLVVGDWKMTAFEMPGMDEMIAAMAEMGGEAADVEAAKAEASAMMDAMVADATLTVNADGTLTVNMMNMESGQTEAKDGTWSLSEDGNTFTMTIDGQGEPMEVFELTASVFSFGMEAEGMSMKMSWGK